MQRQSLRIRSYRSWHVADTASTEAIARIKKLELYEQLKSEGCSTILCLQAIGWSKATYYRWLNRYRRPGWAGLESRSRRPQRARQAQWTKQQEQAVLHLRRRYPLWGKRKLWKMRDVSDRTPSTMYSSHQDQCRWHDAGRDNPIAS